MKLRPFWRKGGWAGWRRSAKTATHISLRVNYVYWQESIYFHCSPKGEKIDNVRRHGKVCFEVDLPLAYLDTDYDKSIPACDVEQFYQCVIIRGQAEILEHPDEKVDALNALMARHENVPQFSDITSETPAVKLCAVVAVRVESLSAKANLAQKKSEAEKGTIRSYLQQRDLPGDREAAALIR